MEFQKERVFTALNADELKTGSKVICAFSIETLKKRVEEGEDITEVHKILPESVEHRIDVYSGDGYFSYSIAYLVSEPEEKKLKWTDLKIGDVIRQKEGMISHLITGIDNDSSTIQHVFAMGTWILDSELEKWEKVE